MPAQPGSNTGAVYVDSGTAAPAADEVVRPDRPRRAPHAHLGTQYEVRTIGSFFAQAQLFRAGQCRHRTLPMTD